MFVGRDKGLAHPDKKNNMEKIEILEKQKMKKEVEKSKISVTPTRQRHADCLVSRSNFP